MGAASRNSLGLVPAIRKGGTKHAADSSSPAADGSSTKPDLMIAVVNVHPFHHSATDTDN